MVEPTRRRVNSSSDEETDETLPEGSFPRIENREQLNTWSRVLHRSNPSNPYRRVKIPWRTILVSILFFIVGSLFLAWGVHDYQYKSGAEAAEKIGLGLILFIPGSYHTVLAIQALRGVEGWDFENLTVFENEKFFEDDF